MPNNPRHISGHTCLHKPDAEASCVDELASQPMLKRRPAVRIVDPTLPMLPPRAKCTLVSGQEFFLYALREAWAKGFQRSPEAHGPCGMDPSTPYISSGMITHKTRTLPDMTHDILHGQTQQVRPGAALCHGASAALKATMLQQQHWKLETLRQLRQVPVGRRQRQKSSKALRSGA